MSQESAEQQIEFDRTSEHEGESIDTAGMMLRVKNRLRKYEGWIRHMYRDVEGYITVGVGFQLKEKSSVGRYTWRYKTTKRSAPLASAYADWVEVSKQLYRRSYTNTSFVASFYDAYTNVELSDTTIGFELSKRLYRLRQDLRQAFPLSGIVFDELPEAVQEAMIDLGWNVTGFLTPTVFPDMKAALKVRDWETAAKESHRKTSQVSETRNTEIYNLIASALGGP